MSKTVLLQGQLSPTDSPFALHEVRVERGTISDVYSLATRTHATPALPAEVVSKLLACPQWGTVEL